MSNNSIFMQALKLQNGVLNLKASLEDDPCQTFFHRMQLVCKYHKKLCLKILGDFQLSNFVETF